MKKWQNPWQKSKSVLPNRYYVVSVQLLNGNIVNRYYSAKYPSGAKDIARQREDVFDAVSATEISKEEFLRIRSSKVEQHPSKVRVTGSSPVGCT